jgi:hypothetical protein
MAYLFKSIRSGTYSPAGVVDIEFLGGKVGDLASWTLTRRGEEGPDADLYDLRATFAYVAEALWDDPDYEKRIVLNLNPTKQYRLQQTDGFPTVRNGRGLLMEGVTIHAVEPIG